MLSSLCADTQGLYMYVKVLQSMNNSFPGGLRAARRGGGGGGGSGELQAGPHSFIFLCKLASPGLVSHVKAPMRANQCGIQPQSCSAAPSVLYLNKSSNDEMSGPIV